VYVYAVGVKSSMSFFHSSNKVFSFGTFPPLVFLLQLRCWALTFLFRTVRWKTRSLKKLQRNNQLHCCFLCNL